MKIVNPSICGCREHRDGVEVDIDGHGFGRETMGLHGDDETGPVVFRWNCSCGIAGRWVHQRRNAYHLWLEHVKRRGPA